MSWRTLNLREEDFNSLFLMRQADSAEERALNKCDPHHGRAHSGVPGEARNHDNPGRE